MVFPVVMYGCESWNVKKAKCQRIEASELWCWRRLLRVPWTARRSNQYILKQISPEYLLEGLMLKLKLQTLEVFIVKAMFVCLFVCLFSSSHALMWELDPKEGWAVKNWYFWTVVLEKTLESLLDSKETNLLKEINSEYSLEGLMLQLKL